MRSGELAKLAGVTVRTLRHYHAIGLLVEPPRSENGYRSYGPGDLLRVLRIRQLASLGFTLEKIGPMLDGLDEERAREGSLPGETPSAPVCRLLDELDRALAGQIELLERQRAAVARLRRGGLSADYPERAASALGALRDFEELSGCPGILDSALSQDDWLAMGIAAHLYSDAELSEIERVFRAIPERGLTDEYRRLGELYDGLPRDASEGDREAAIEAGMAFLERLLDCFDSRNWLRPDTDCDRLLERAAASGFNEAQVAVSDELFRRFTRRMGERAGGGRG